MFGFFGIFSLIPLIIISLIVFWIIRHRKKGHPSQDREWYLRFALSKEDAVSQLFLLLSFFFLGVTLLAFNRDLGDPFSWRTVLFITSVIGLVGMYRASGIVSEKVQANEKKINEVQAYHEKDVELIRSSIKEIKSDQKVIMSDIKQILKEIR